MEQYAMGNTNMNFNRKDAYNENEINIYIFDCGDDAVHGAIRIICASR